MGEKGGIGRIRINITLMLNQYTATKRKASPLNQDIKILGYINPFTPIR
jgi:hypothetical protein